MELPFAGIHQLCSPLFDRLDALPGPQRDALAVALGLSAGEPPDRFLVGLAVLGLLCGVAEERPLLCVVDDAQWLDEASDQLLGFVARRLLADPVAIVVAVRDGSGGRGFDGLPDLLLGGLDDHDARALLSSAVAGRVDGSVRDRIISRGPASTCSADTSRSPRASGPMRRRCCWAGDGGELGAPGRGGPRQRPGPLPRGRLRRPRGDRAPDQPVHVDVGAPGARRGRRAGGRDRGRTGGARAPGADHGAVRHGRRGRHRGALPRAAERGRRRRPAPSRGARPPAPHAAAAGARPRASALRGVVAPRASPCRRAFPARCRPRPAHRDRHGGVRRARPPRAPGHGPEGPQAHGRDARRADRPGAPGGVPA